MTCRQLGGACEKEFHVKTFEEMADFLKSKKLALFKLPERLEVVAELPLVPAGQKVDVMRLEKEIAEKLGEEQKQE